MELNHIIDQIIQKQNQQSLTVSRRNKDSVGDDNKTLEKTTFLVGRDAVPIKAYSFILAASSPVFKAKLFSSTAVKNGPVHLKDDCPEAFRALVEYLRSKKLNIEDYGVAVRLAKMAHKYTMPALMKKCMVYMSGDNDHWYALEYYELLKSTSKDKNVISETLHACQLIAEELLESNRHLNVGVDTLIQLFNCEELNITSEMTLVEALARYEQAHDEPSLKESLRTALLRIRLLTLEPMQLLECSIITKLLRPDDIEKIVHKIVSPSNIYDMPENFTQSLICRGNFWNRFKSIRNCLGKFTTTTLEKYTLCSADIYSHEPSCISGVILGVAGSQAVPFLDVILYLYDEKGALVAMKRHRLKNLTNNGKICRFAKGNSFWINEQRFRLNILVMSRVSITGRYGGNTRSSQKVLIECKDKDPINCFVKGFLCKEINHSMQVIAIS